MTKIETDTLILGAGWSGLAAADMISKGKRPVVILEKEQDTGGLAKTIDFKGFKFDLGGHRLCFKEEENVDYLKGIFEGGGLISLKRTSKIFFGNKYIDYPANLSSMFYIDKKYIINILFDLFRSGKKVKEDNFEEWVKANYGECLYNIYFKDYTEKVWGESCANLSSNWADKRIGNHNLFSFFGNIFVPGYKVKDTAPFFNYPAGGLGHLVWSLQKRVTNCRIYKNVRLGGFCCKNGILSSVSFVSDGDEVEVSFKKVISTIPIKEIIAVLPGVPEGIRQLVSREIKYRSLILACLIIKRKLVTGWHWCYFPSKDILFSRVHEPKFWVRQMAPEDKTLICTEIFCNYADSFWSMKDSGLIEKASQGLQSAGLAVGNEDILDARVERIEYAYPLHYRGFERPLVQVKEFLKSFSNLDLAGRSGTHSYFDMEECLDNVREALIS